MADKTIPALEEATAANGLGWLVIDTGIETKKVRAKNFKRPGSFDVIIGSGEFCTHALLEDAVADGDYGTDLLVLLTESRDVAVNIDLSKAGWRIYALPGVTYTKVSTATHCLAPSAARIEVSGLRMSGFGTGIICGAGAEYCRFWNLNFESCNVDITDTAVANLKKPTVFGNTFE